MEGTRNGNKLTEQGVGSPVPVGIAGERAGPARSLASDCSALSVDSQAEVQENATGRGEEEKESGTAANSVPGGYNWRGMIDPFARRASIGRSPQGLVQKKDRREVGISCNELTRSNSYSEGTKVNIKNVEIVANPGGMKRKASNHATANPREVLKKKANPVAADFMDMLELLQKASTKLNGVVSAHLNTKKEIKEVNNDLQRIGMFLKRSSVKDLLDSVKWEKVETPTYDADTQTENKLAKSTTVTIGVQTDWRGIKKEQEILAEKEREEVLSMLSSPGGFERLEKIIDRSWPEEVFTSTSFERSSLDTVAMEGDVALVVNPGNILDCQMNRKLADRIPALAVLSEEKLVEGQLEFVTLHTEMVNRRGGNIGKTHTLYALPLTMDETGMTNVNALFENCIRLREQLKGPKPLKLIATGKIDMGYLRKCLEYVFKNTETKVTIVDHNKEMPDKRNLIAAEVKKRRLLDPDKIIVKANGKSNADLLRDVKSRVDIEAENIKVKSVKKTAEGDLLMEVVGSCNAERLKKAIKENMGDAQTIHRANGMVLHLTDTDADVGETKVKKAVEKVFPGMSINVEVSAMRPMNNGNLATTIRVNKEEIAKEKISRLSALTVASLDMSRKLAMPRPSVPLVSVRGIERTSSNVLSTDD
nr:unnamed protein product [Callosobruchus chinensis]